MTASPPPQMAAKYRPIESVREQALTTSADLVQGRDVAVRRQPGLARRSRLSARQTAWLAAGLIVVLCALVVPPFVFLMQGSVSVAGPDPNVTEWGLNN